MIAGFALVVLALLAWLVVAHLRERRFFDRPGIARQRWFDPAMIALAVLLLAGGLLLLWRRAPAIGGATGALLAAAGLLRQGLRSGWSRRRAFSRDVARARLVHPGLAERDLLIRAVLDRHPAWGEELVSQMVLDYPEPADLGRVVARMERGFRGFR